MLLGIDINHPEPGSNQPSVASLVASMDGRLAEYAANVSCQTSNSETCNYLSEATENLVKTFFRKNNCYPKRIIIFRDGVRYYYHYYLRSIIFIINLVVKVNSNNLKVKLSQSKQVSKCVDFT